MAGLGGKGKGDGKGRWERKRDGQIGPVKLDKTVAREELKSDK